MSKLIGGNIIINKKDRLRLLAAIKQKNPKNLSIVLKSNPQIDKNVLVYAVNMQCIEIIKMIFDYWSHCDIYKITKREFSEEWYYYTHIKDIDWETLDAAIKTHDPEIVRFLISVKAEKHTKTIKSAIETQNYQIIDMMSEYQPLNRNLNSDVNSNDVLACAAKTLDPKKMFGKSYGSPIYEFHRYADKMDNDVNYDLIKMLMCSGAIIEQCVYDQIINKINKTYIELKILDCNKLWQQKYDPGDKNIEILKKDLIVTMNMLMNECPIEKNNQKIIEMDNAMNQKIMIPLVEIIYQYQMDPSMVEFIDWSKY